MALQAAPDATSSRAADAAPSNAAPLPVASSEAGSVTVSSIVPLEVCNLQAAVERKITEALRPLR